MRRRTGSLERLLDLLQADEALTENAPEALFFEPSVRRIQLISHGRNHFEIALEPAFQVANAVPVLDGIDELAESAEPVDLRLDLSGERFSGGRVVRTLDGCFDEIGDLLGQAEPLLNNVILAAVGDESRLVGPRLIGVCLPLSAVRYRPGSTIHSGKAMRYL